MFANYLIPYTPGSGSSSLMLITDTAIIARIINPINWNGLGEYTGSVAGLVEGNYYFDDALNVKYEFFGKLRRFNYNTLI